MRKYERLQYLISEAIIFEELVHYLFKPSQENDPSLFKIKPLLFMM